MPRQVAGEERQQRVSISERAVEVEERQATRSGERTIGGGG
jgi:hypothetical protein